MIGSFWNLCRACPSMPVDKLHSEYRSTYKWHEFKAEAKSGVVSQPAPNPAPGMPATRAAAGMPSNPIEPAMPRRKKYPGVAYKANEFFVPAPVDGIRPQTGGFNRARSVQRDDTTDRAGRRSKSEGPRQTRWTDTIEPKATTALGETLATKEPLMASTEYRNQFAWPKDTTDSAPRKSISMGALKKAAVAEGSVEAEPLMGRVDEDRISKSYNEDYLWNGQKKGVQRKSTFRSALSALISNGDRSKDNKKRYKSEYKKKFRPFSQYVFESSKGTFTKCRGKDKDGDREASERMLGDKVDAPAGEDTAATLQAAGLQPLGLPQGDSWYREVMDLRKRAGEYKYRGWGTELAPEHLTQLYNKQMDLWYQVSKRSSLSALSLAATNHRAIQSEEKEKDSKTASPKKFRSFKSAPHQSIHAKLQESKAVDRSPLKTSPQKQRKKIQGQSFDEGNAQVDGAKPEQKGEFRSPRRRPRSADPAPVAQKHLPNGDAHPRPYKPTDDDTIPSHRSASVAKDQYFDDSPVIKSPPEPTRVKSPEQMNMRSPDPVNWTVPLDTGKTFTVTQNVKSDEIKRPNSEVRSAMEEQKNGPTTA